MKTFFFYILFTLLLALVLLGVSLVFFFLLIPLYSKLIAPLRNICHIFPKKYSYY